MLSRDQVLHVARLARLELTEEEVERFAGELSKVLDHIEKISELDLENVDPTSHVVEVDNVLRADVPRESWPRVRISSIASPAVRESRTVKWSCSIKPPTVSPE
jgi:aspartyl-tRNA(Asn)/glutamyl-tRNA(Gln) amidotransferase subunit C